MGSTCELPGDVDGDEGVFERVEPGVQVSDQAVVQVNEVSSFIEDSVLSVV